MRSIAVLCLLAISSVATAQSYYGQQADGYYSYSPRPSQQYEQPAYSPPPVYSPAQPSYQPRPLETQSEYRSRYYEQPETIRPLDSVPTPGHIDRHRERGGPGSAIRLE